MNDNHYHGVGILDVLLILFIVLKLTGQINWSWPVVLIPLWIIIFLTIVIFIWCYWDD